MKKLRLLTTANCNRKCNGRCNEQFDLDALPIMKNEEFANYSEVSLTGGEPLLYPEQVESLALTALENNEDIKVWLYTAHLQYLSDNQALRILRVLDGVTLTLHNQSDVYQFTRFAEFFEPALELLDKIYGKKSYRVNVEEGVKTKFRKLIRERWAVKVIEWVDDCPLPENEEFKRTY